MKGAERGLPVNGDGRDVRDRLRIEDHRRGIDLVVRRGGSGETYNIGGRADAEGITMVCEPCCAADAKLDRCFPAALATRDIQSASLITFFIDRAGQDRRCAIDCSKAERQLGIVSGVSLSDRLRATIAWYVETEDWWFPVLHHRGGEGRESAVLCR